MNIERIKRIWWFSGFLWGFVIGMLIRGLLV